MNPIKPIEWKDDRVILLDQRLLPLQEVYITCDDYKAVADAIKSMVIRGAPAIGVAAAMGVALGGLGIGVKTFDEFFARLNRICETIEATRPTAVNLFWGTNRMKQVCLDSQHLPIPALQQRLKDEAIKIYHEDIETNRLIGKNGATLFNDGDRVLTHCNAGALATAGFGTALGVLYAATESGKTLTVIADETRPYLQGSRLTAWELDRHGIDVTVITDNMAGYMMQQGHVDKIIVGADRIAANGDVANKIGTYSVAILAKHHNIPLYVAAPMSTIDFQMASGAGIVIEERPSTEVTHINTTQLVPTNVKVRNPSFDVTPANLVSAIIIERGIATAPYTESLLALRR